jgi:hypothetical protein
MIKYYCDKCKKEITDNRLVLRVRCRGLLGNREIEMTMHKDCAVKFIGAEIIEEEKMRREEFYQRVAKRRAKRETGDAHD